MASLEMAPTQMFDFVPKNPNRKEKNHSNSVKDHFNTCRVFPLNDSGSNEEAKSKEVLECSSRSSVSETLQIPSSNSIPASSPIEINSVRFCNPGQPEKPSRNEIMVGASSLVHIWEARSQQSSSNQSQSLNDCRKSYGLSLSENSYSSSFSDSLNNNGNIDWCSQSDRSYVSDSYEKEKEGRCYLRIRGRQAYIDFLMMIQCDREKELEGIVDLYAVSKFSSRGCERLQYMLRIRCFERCIAIQERHRSKSVVSNASRSSSRGPGVMNIRDRYKKNTGKVNSAVETRISSNLVSSQVKKVYNMDNKAANKNVLQEKTEKVKDTMEKSIVMGTHDASYKLECAKKNVSSESADSTNSFKKTENTKKATGEGSREAIVKESVEENKTSLSIAEKVNLWDSKERTYRRKNTEKAKNTLLQEGARRVIDMETRERNKERRNRKVSSYEKGKSMEIEEYIINPQEDETGSHISRESGKEKKASVFDEKIDTQQASETLCLILESPRFLNDWYENEGKDEDYSGGSMYYDWVSDISRPRSYWEGLRKQREHELMSKDSKKDDIKGLIKGRTVSSILASDIREKIDKILISRAQIRLQVEEEEDNQESLVEYSARYQEELEENGKESVDLETITVSDGFSHYSARSFEEHEAAATIPLNPKDHADTFSETEMICDLTEQIKQLQGEMIQLKNWVNSCTDFMKSVKLESVSGTVSDSLKRKCFICLEMPVNSLLYRCGHMCTCLKCGHELQWSSKKCPICMAPIIDVVRAFLDS